MARHPRRSSSSSSDPQRVSPNRRVVFKDGLISGPSARFVPSSEGSVSDVSGDGVNDDLPQDQLLGDLDHATEEANDDPEKGDTPGNAKGFWKKLLPGILLYDAATPFNKLSCGQKDYRVCKGMNFLVDEIVRFAEDHAGKGDKRFMDNLLIEDNKALIRYIGCLAQGGSKGKGGWKKLLTDQTCRQAIVVGVVGRAIEEHVFSSLYFGAHLSLAQQLEELEQDNIDGEGFSRTRNRSEAIISARTNRKPKDFERAVANTSIQLTRMLEAFCADSAGLSTGLYSIVHHAGLLSRMMRLAPDVVYYWPPTFKDEEFEPGRMEAYNLAEMIEGSPYDRKTVNGRERAILKPGRENESEAIVRVVCFPGLVAYRQFGGELAKKEIEAESRGMPVPEDVQAHRRRAGELPLKSDQGIRSRVIRKSLVLLQWGKQRLLTKEAGTSSHIDAVRDDNMAKYDDDYAGFEELYEIAEARWAAGR